MADSFDVGRGPDAAGGDTPGNSPDVVAGDVTALLVAARGGDRAAMDQIFALVYRELRVLAHRQLGRGRASDTLSTTALVHEVYLKLAHNRGVAPNDRGHFFAVAARAMRQIVVDYARRRGAEKRGGGVRPEVLDDERMGLAAQVVEVLAVDAALTRLEALDARLGRIVELRFFAGLSVEETAEALSTSETTVKRDWRKARAFLSHELER